ncbi:MAG: transposase, partial [Planctomycetota bacterium]
MSNSLLYHGFGVRGYHYERTEYRSGAVTFTISQPRESYRCSQCGSEDVIGRGGHDRRFRTLPIGGKPVYVAFWVPRVECRGCGAVRRVKVGFADQRVSYTRAFERYALELSRYMTIKDVACHLQISWDVIKLYNDKLSGLRRDLHRQLTDTMQKDALKGIRWLLLKRPEHLDPDRKEPERLNEALRLNEPLAMAYYLKEELNEIWEQDDEEAAEALLTDWILYAESSGV